MSIVRVSDLLSLYKSRYRKEDVLAAKREGRWKCCSSADLVRFSDEISLGLLALDIRKGDKLGIMSPNRPEWNFVDFGAMQIGAVTVPLYPTMSLRDLEYILRDAEIKILFISGPPLYEKISVLREHIPGVEVFSFDAVEGVRSWEDVRNLGRGKDAASIEPVRLEVQPDDLLTLIYTSGTTGNPKGVMLTHRNIVSNVVACEQLLPGTIRTALSFLPLCHIFERMVSYLYFYRGISIYYAESIESIAENMREIRPDVFTTVPRLLEKVYDRIVARGSALSGLKRALFFWALGLGLRYEREGAGGKWYAVRLKIANRLVFRKWRAALGGNIKLVVAGGAALQPRLAKVFNAAGIPVLQGYGLTETSPVIA
ncbi:MAG TPA: AMP-binding protein, partial [Anseongella sp.]|nr:AMP-binding protein [Anseongella sp.]